MKIEDFLSARHDGDAWTFEIPIEMHGAFGGAFGGIVAAAALVAARPLAPGRVPVALDCRFLRGLPAGRATARPQLLHAGRSLACVSVDVTDERGRLATRATVSLVDPAALRDIERPARSAPDLQRYEDAPPWPPVAPIVKTIDARTVGRDGAGYATAVRVPWDVSPETSAEAACLAGDMCVGPPVGAAAGREGVSHPNPDLSLRFCGEVTEEVVVGVGTMERASGGVAAVSIDVWSGGAPVAFGVSCSLLIPTG